MQKIAEAVSRLKQESAGTKSFEVTKEMLVEKAKRDCELLNREVYKPTDENSILCDKCNNRGFFYVPNGMYIAKQDCECQKARKTMQRMIDSGLGTVISKYTFKRYNASEDWQKQIKEAAENYVRCTDGSWFFIGGESGAGKSHICTAICRELLRTKEIKYMLWEEESVALKSAKMDFAVYQPRIQALREAEVLYVDDFLGRKNGSNEPTEADITFARELFNHRYFSGFQTIISTEWYSSEILALDKGLGGRIIESCNGFMFNIGRDSGKNYRLKKASKLL